MGTNKRRRHSQHQRRGSTPGIPLSSFCQVRNPRPPIEILDEEQIEDIHRASLRVLQEGGIRVLSTSVRSLLRTAGARVDEASAIVYMDPEMVEEYLRYLPSEIHLTARNPAKSIIIGGNHINFALVNGPAFVSDLERGRRSPCYADFCELMKLSYSLNIIHLGGAAPVAPMDLPATTRHLDMYFAAITLHDKFWQANLLGGARARDGLEMIAIVHGIARSDLVNHPPLIAGNINTNSPRQLDASMSDGMLELVSHGQPVIVTPFTLLGAMAPTTIAGALVQQNAEALLCITLAQIVRKGAPMVYGAFTSNVDMQSGSPAFGTPEYAIATQAGAQLARRYGIPYRASSTNASNCVDGQAVYESQMSIWSAVMAHTNIVNHAGGWLEGGLTASYEKLVIDAEMLQMMAKYLQPVEVNEDTLAVEAIKGVPPGGHFFDSAHTLQRYENIFYKPIVSDWCNFERWKEKGSQTVTERALHVWKRLLAEYEQPPLDPAVVEELTAYVARRKREIALTGVGGEGYS